MKHFGLAASTAFVTISLAASAQAQVTPEQVWQNWQTFSAAYGQALVADQVVRKGDTLVVSGMKFSMDQPDIKVTGTLSEARFKDLGDGTVEVTVADTYPIKMVFPDQDGETQEVDLTISQPGLNMIAGGGDGETSYVFDAPTIGINAVGHKAGKTVVDIATKLTGMTGAYLVSIDGQVTQLETNIEAQTLSFTAKGGDDVGTFDMTGNMAAIKLATNGTFLGLAAMENIGQALKDGFVSDSGFSYGAGSFAIDVTEGEKATKINAINESGSFGFSMSKDSLFSTANGAGVSITMSGGDIPFPELKIAYGEAGYEFFMPLLASATPADFGFLSRLVDFSISDEVWGMLDPTAALPRDPVTVIVDAKGTATLTTDLMDEAAMASLGDAPPGQINSLDITELQVKGAGAELTGSGSATFDNTDLVTFDGIPTPTGKVELVLKGGNGVLDKLVAMGIIPADDAMAARMMLALFAKAGEGEDVLNSTLEFKDKGFFANGQRLK